MNQSDSIDIFIFQHWGHQMLVNTTTWCYLVRAHFLVLQLDLVSDSSWNQGGLIQSLMFPACMQNSGACHLR